MVEGDGALAKLDDVGERHRLGAAVAFADPDDVNVYSCLLRGSANKPDTFHRLVNELLENAIKFRVPGGGGLAEIAPVGWHFRTKT